MFAATVHQVVRAVGKDSLFPVQSLDVADNIFPLSLVLKESERHFLFWTKKKCFTTEFKLADILQNHSKEISVDKNKSVVCSFNRTTDISLKGKFGVELTKELVDVDLEGARSVVVKSPLGDLEKEEVVLQSLLKEINSRKIKTDHPLVKPLISESKTLCVVTGVISLSQDALLSSEVKMDESGKVGGGLSCISSRVHVSAHVSEEVDEKKSKTLKLQKGTPLAYTCYELLVSTKDGSFQVQVDRDSAGGFTTDRIMAAADEVDGPADSFSGIESSGNPGAIFKALTDLPDDKREQLRGVIRGIVEMPQTIQPLSELLKQSEMFFENNIEKTTNVETLRKKLGTMDDDLQEFLTLLDFHIKDGVVEYPRAGSELFQACHLLLMLLTEFDDDELEAIARCLEDGETAQDLLKILVKTQNRSIEKLELTPEEAAILTTDTAKTFIDAIDLKLEENSLILPAGNRMDINAAYFVIFALYGN